MKVFEYKDVDEQEWSVLHFAPGNWEELIRLADKWKISVREINLKDDTVTREYHPAQETKDGKLPVIGNMKSDVDKIRRHF